MDLLDAYAYHQLALSAEGRAPATLRLYAIYERRFLEYLAEHKIAPNLDALNPLNVRNGLEWFRGQSDGARGGKVSSRTFVATLKTWASFLETEGVYTESPIARVKRPRVPQVLRQPFTTQEILAMWAAARQTRSPTRDEALLLLLLDTGMRIGEAVTLTLDKLQLDQRHVIVGLHGKGRRERLVPIGDPSKRDGGRTIRALRAWLRERPDCRAPEVFVDRHGYAISADAGGQAIKRIGQLARVANPIAHRTRHTFCTWYLTANPGDELGLRRIVGHLSGDVTADYVHLSQTTIADRAGRSSLVESLGGPKAEAPRARTLPIANAWGIGKLEAAPHATTSRSVSELLAGLDVVERESLRRALLDSVA